MRAGRRPPMLEGMARFKLVIVFPEHDLLGWTIGQVLAPETEWELVQVTPGPCPEQLLQQVRAHDPHAVILSRDSAGLECALLPWLQDARPNARLITLSGDSNSFTCYEKQCGSLQQPHDLHALLRHPLALPTSGKEDG
jgi:hypothetical protein